MKQLVLIERKAFDADVSLELHETTPLYSPRFTKKFFTPLSPDLTIPPPSQHYTVQLPRASVIMFPIVLHKWVLELDQCNAVGVWKPRVIAVPGA